MSIRAVKVDVGTIRADGELSENLQRIERDILKRIGAYMQGVTSRAFGDQGRPGGTWQPRMTPSVPSIVKQLNRGQNPSKKYFESAPALIDTGTLSRSIAFEVKGREVEIGATAPYATQMQEGGESQITLTDQGRAKLGEWMRSLPKRRRREVSAEIGWLFRRPTFTVKARARPFLIVTDDDEKKFAEIAAEELEAAGHE